MRKPLHKYRYRVSASGVLSGPFAYSDSLETAIKRANEQAKATGRRYDVYDADETRGVYTTLGKPYRRLN